VTERREGDRMQIAGRREVIHIYDVCEYDRKCLDEAGFVDTEETDFVGNEIWDREDNFYCKGV
jgi:hypothetical protein